MLTLLPKGVQTKYLKLSWLKVFSICHQCKTIPVYTLSFEYLREFKKIEMAQIGYSEAWGKLFHDKKPEGGKSRGTVPLSTTAIKESLWIP